MSTICQNVRRFAIPIVELAKQYQVSKMVSLTMNNLFKRKVLIGLTALVVTGALAVAISFVYKDQKKTVPVIYTTDLFHPHGDMDDQVDLACLYALENLDIRLLVLDNSEVQEKRPGLIPVTQMNFLTKRSVKAVPGLPQKLTRKEDTGIDQDSAGQRGVTGILNTLKESKEKITFISVGSLRDVAAAFNRAPELFREKVAKVFVFAGEASKQTFSETNVRMDPKAFQRILTSGLPIYWVPCFDGGRWKNYGKSSYWLTRYRDILSQSTKPLLLYFIYAAQRSTDEPIQYLYSSIDQTYLSSLLKKKRNLWGAATFLAIDSKTIVQRGRSFEVIDMEPTVQKDQLFNFVPVHLSVTDEGVVRYVSPGEGSRVFQFQVLKKNIIYAEGMTYATAQLLNSLNLK